MDLVCICGSIKGNIQDNGNKTLCMVKARSNGLTEELTRVNINRIKEKDMVFFLGQMVEGTRVYGKMGNNMEWVFFIQLMVNLLVLNGLMGDVWKMMVTISLKI